MIESYHSFSFKISIWDFSYFLISRWEVRQHCAPYPALLTDFNGLTNRCMLFPFCIFCQRIFKSGLMYQESDFLAIIHHVLTRIGISGVENASETIFDPAFVVRNDEATIRFQAVVCFNCEDLLYIHFLLDNLQHFLCLRSFWLMIINYCCDLFIGLF